MVDTFISISIFLLIIDLIFNHEKTVQFNKKITMHYSISNDKGLVFESTFNSSPITFKIGDGTIPQKLGVCMVLKKMILKS